MRFEYAARARSSAAGRLVNELAAATAKNEWGGRGERRRGRQGAGAGRGGGEQDYPQRPQQ
jgi:hypothetical protein